MSRPLPVVPERVALASTRATLAPTRDTLQVAEYVPAIPVNQVSRDQHRIGVELVRRMAATEAQGFTGAVGTQTLAAMHRHADVVMVAEMERAAAILEQPRSDTAQQLVQHWMMLSVDDSIRHVRGNLEVAAYNITRITAESYDLPEDTRSRLRRAWEGSRR